MKYILDSLFINLKRVYFSVHFTYYFALWLSSSYKIFDFNYSFILIIFYYINKKVNFVLMNKTKSHRIHYQYILFCICIDKLVPIPLVDLNCSFILIICYYRQHQLTTYQNYFNIRYHTIITLSDRKSVV